MEKPQPRRVGVAVRFFIQSSDGCAPPDSACRCAMAAGMPRIRKAYGQKALAVATRY